MMEFGIRTDTGRAREANEDCYGSDPRINLFVLSDGMGGLECGEVASRIAIDAVIEHCREANENPALPLKGKLLQGVSETANRLASAIRLANQAVRGAALERAMSNGMGATIVAIQFAGERMSLAHVGDSRAYRLRGDEFEQLTRDHSYVADQVRQGKMSEEQAAESTLKNVLIRALGVEPEVDVDVSDELVMEDDVILMCSDGLTNELSDAQIAAVLGETEDPQEAADRLVGLANEAGGGDNITAIVLRPAPRPVGAIGRFIRCFRG
jgi:serine/threonine protein phosphatase PrpC